MCDASDFAIGAILGQTEDGKPYVIYYVSKTLNEAQRNYNNHRERIVSCSFFLRQIPRLLSGSFIVVFTDHSALKYLLTKQDAKARLSRWILLLQEFNLQIKDKKGVEKVVADHLSRLSIAHNSHSLPINDDFPNESLMLIKAAPWYAHIANYLVTGELPTIPCKRNDHRVVLKFLKENIFSRFGVPKAIIRMGEAIQTLSVSREARPRASSPQDSFKAPQVTPIVPSSEGGVPSSPPQRRYTRWRPLTSPPPKPSVHHIPPKRAKTSGPGETSRHAQLEPQDPTDSQRPSSIASEAIIKRPMVTARPLRAI
ncbi:Retrovirus-related Pol polyprotein from transposon opus [Vitis vinifera]|uniref:Retrovirus-related Pol polyprotein from transposon opus n=1 Tax=Vitis vinifera TaxID=29760 RepID=A0A438G6U9_VITVI|nr:Retrovirus-related Pol polyprotein from transposon opus [Vitis vinifera]